MVTVDVLAAAASGALVGAAAGFVAGVKLAVASLFERLTPDQKLQLKRWINAL